MLTGTYDRNLDAKGRLSLPAAVRKEFGDKVHVLPAPDVDALYVFSESGYKAWIDSLFERNGGYDPRNPDDEDLMRVLNGLSASSDIDSAARISISDFNRKVKGLSREVTVVGNGDHLEVWDRETWQQHQAAALDKLQALFFGRSK